MKVKILKPRIPVLWLDNWFIWRASEDFWKKLALLVLERKIIVLDTGQYAEMQERYYNQAAFTDESRRKLALYKNIVSPYISIDHSSFLGRQTAIAMKAYAESDNQLIFKFDQLFDPLIQRLTPLLDLLNRTFGAKWGTSRQFKTLSFEISIDWKKIRKDALIKKETLSERQNKEILGMHNVIRTIANGSDPVKKRNLVDYYFNLWKEQTEDGNFDEMLKFFKSDYYKFIPYVEIHSWLISDLITGARDPKSSDYFDIVMIAMALPFTDYMILDGDMRGRILNNRLKLVAPKGDYSCKLIKESELNDILGKL